MIIVNLNESKAVIVVFIFSLRMPSPNWYISVDTFDADISIEMRHWAHSEGGWGDAVANRQWIYLYKSIDDRYGLPGLIGDSGTWTADFHFVMYSLGGWGTRWITVSNLIDLSPSPSLEQARIFRIYEICLSIPVSHNESKLTDAKCFNLSYKSIWTHLLIDTILFNSSFEAPSTPDSHTPVVMFLRQNIVLFDPCILLCCNFFPLFHIFSLIAYSSMKTIITLVLDFKP